LRPTSLRSALLLHVTLPLALSLALAVIVGQGLLERSVERRMEEDVELVARAIQPALSRAMERDRARALQGALDAAFSIDRVFGAYVYDAEGNRIATAGREGTPPARGEVSRIARNRSNVGEYGRLGSRDVYSYFVPLTDSGSRNIGLLQVTRRARDMDDYMGDLRRHAAAYSILALASVTLLVGYGHQGAVVGHIARVVDSVKRIESGERTHRAPETGPREIVQLARSLNAMLDSIDRAECEITARREAERELDRRLKKAEKLAAIGRLAAGAAHELAAPVNVVSGAATRALRAAPGGDGHFELTRIRNASIKMERIVRQLLDFGREPSSGRRAVSAARLVRSAASAIDREVEIEGPEPAPSVSVDAFRFEQALANLLRNAAHAAPDGRVRISWVDDGDVVGFHVDDDGPGVPEELRGRLFEPFFTTKRVGEGTGLGLTLVEIVVNEHGGSVELEDGPWKGARFSIRLAAANAEKAP
jgi:signal transduction histidine kinase